MKDSKLKSKIDADDNWNRTFYGSPTIGGIVIIGMIIIILVLK